MKKKTIRFLIAYVLLALAAASAEAGAFADLEAAGFVWTTFDETTGFVVHNNTDDPYSAYSGGVWGAYWSTGTAPERGTNYYSNGRSLYAPKLSSGHPVFAGDLLVLDAKMETAQASKRLTFNDFVGLGGGRIGIRSTGQGLIVNGDAHFRSTAENPFLFSRNAKFGSLYTYPITVGGSLSSTKDTVISLSGESTFADSNAWWMITLDLSATDASKFLGTLLITDASLNMKTADFGGAVVMTNCWLGVTEDKLGQPVTNTPARVFADTVAPHVNRLELNEGTRLDLSASTYGWTVGTLSSAGGEVVVNVAQTENSGGCLTVTQAVDFRKPLKIVNSAAVWTAVNENAPAEMPVVVFGANVDLSGVTLDEFILESNMRSDASLATYPIQRLKLAAAGDGTTVLYVTRNRIVSNIVLDADTRSRHFKGGSPDTFWSDGLNEHGCVDYYLRFNGRAPQYWFNTAGTFPAENFLFANGEMFFHANVTVTNLVLATAKCSLNNSATTGNGILSGRLGIFNDGTDGVVFAAKSTAHGLEIASEIYGPGKISIRNVGAKTFSGHSPSFSGKIVFETAGTGTQGTLYIGYGDSLGGALSAFTYDAVTLSAGAALSPLRDLTLAEPTRGLLVSGDFTVAVPEGVTMGVDSVMTWNGALAKTGAGTLALGSAPRFVDGDAATDPVESMNVLTVSGGTLKATAADALNGLSVVFASETELCLPYQAEAGDFRAKGLIMTRTGASLSVEAGARLTVRVDVGDSGVETFEHGLATFADEASAQAFAGSISAKTSVRGIRGAVSVTEADGLYTVQARFRRPGIHLSIR